MNKLIKSLDICKRTLCLNVLEGIYNITIQEGEQIVDIVNAPDLKTAMFLFEKTELELYRNFN